MQARQAFPEQDREDGCALLPLLARALEELCAENKKLTEETEGDYIMSDLTQHLIETARAQDILVTAPGAEPMIICGVTRIVAETSGPNPSRGLDLSWTRFWFYNGTHIIGTETSPCILEAI